MGGKQAGWQYFASADWSATRDAFAVTLGQREEPLPVAHQPWSQLATDEINRIELIALIFQFST
jgi:hypothetical protein